MIRFEGLGKLEQKIDRSRKSGSTEYVEQVLHGRDIWRNIACWHGDATV